MKQELYEFDPCLIDGSDNQEEDEEITLDNWKPTAKRKKIMQSEWRKNEIGHDYNQQPSLDDMRKIKMHLNKDVSDGEIMQVFGINCETLLAIKKDNYCPVDGIKLDNLSKIYKHFDYIEKKLHYLKRANNYMSKLLFMDEISLKKFTDYCGKNFQTKIDKDEADYDY